jgi:hypothetical protein
MKPKRVRIALALGVVVLLPVAAFGQTIVQPAPAPAPVVVQPPPGQVVIPPAQQAVTETSTGPSALLVGGLIGFGISYGASVAVAATSDHPGDHHLYVPVIGPWLDLANRGSCPVEKTSCDSETTNKVFLVIDGVIQGGSAISVVAGLLSPAETRTKTTTVARKGIHLTPVSYGRGSPGLAAFGSF